MNAGDQMIAIQFGTEARERYFGIDPKISLLDQSKYGVIPNCVRDIEKNPKEWGSKVHDTATSVMNQIAEYLNFNAADAVFMKTCSEALQIVINANLTDNGEKILIMSDCGKEIKNVIKANCNAKGTAMDILNAPLPLAEISLLMNTLEEALVRNKYNLVVLEYVSSKTGIKYPIEILVKICKRHGVKTVVYGCCAVGQVPCNVPNMQADYFITSFNKWCFCMRNIALLWRSKEGSCLEPNPLVKYQPKENDTSTLMNQFYNFKTLDPVQLVSISYGFEFMESVGGFIKICEYNIRLLKRAVRHLVITWGTKTLKLTRAVRSPFVSFVRLPINVERYFIAEFGPAGAPKQLESRILGSYNIALGAKIIDGLLYCRLTAHIYNTAEDYVNLGRLIMELNESLTLTSYKPT